MREFTQEGMFDKLSKVSREVNKAKFQNMDLPKYIGGGATNCPQGLVWDEKLQDCVRPMQQMEEVLVTPVTIYTARYQDQNPYAEFFAKKKAEYIKRAGNFGKITDLEANFPDAQIKKIKDEYEYNKNNYVASKLGYNYEDREKWVDKLSPSARNVLQNSKYASKLQPSLWAKTEAGARALVNTLLPGQPISYNVKGLSPKEEAAYKKDKLAAFDAVSFADIPGAVVFNALADSRPYAKNPGVLSGEVVNEAGEMGAGLLNPLVPIEMATGVSLAPDLIELGLKGAQGAYRTGKQLTKTLDTNPQSWFQSPEERLYNEELYKGLGSASWNDPLGKLYEFNDARKIKAAQQRESRLLDPVRGDAKKVAEVRSKLGDRSFDKVVTTVGKNKSERALRRSNLPIEPIRFAEGNILGGGEGNLYVNQLNPEEVVKIGIKPGTKEEMEELVRIGNEMREAGVEGFENVALPRKAMILGEDPIRKVTGAVEFQPWLGNKLDPKNPIVTPFGGSRGQGSLEAKNNLINTVKELDKRGVGIDYPHNNIMYDPASDSYKLVDFNHVGESPGFSWNKRDMPVEQRLQSEGYLTDSDVSIFDVLNKTSNKQVDELPLEIPKASNSIEEINYDTLSGIDELEKSLEGTGYNFVPTWARYDPDELEGRVFQNQKQISQDAWPMEVPKELRNRETQEEFFKQSSEFANKWYKKDPKAYDDAVQKLDEVRNNSINKLFTQDELALLNTIETAKNNIRTAYIKNNNIDLRYDPTTGKFNDENLKKHLEDLVDATFLSDPKNVELQLKKDIIWNSVTAEHDRLKNIHRQTIVDNLEPDFKRKVEGLYELSGKSEPTLTEWTDSILPSQENLVHYGAKEPSFNKLRTSTKDYLIKNVDDIRGVRMNDGETVTLGSSPSKEPGKFFIEPDRGAPVFMGNEWFRRNPVKLSDPNTWGNIFEKKVSKAKYKMPHIDDSERTLVSVNYRQMTDPQTIAEVNAHEIGHTQQRVANWRDLIQEYNPTFEYYTNHDKNELASTFKDAMVEPQLPGTSGSNADKYDYETWKSGVGELHSELNKSRFNAAQRIMKLGYSMDEAIQILKKYEAEGNDELFQYYIDASGDLDKHFKPSVDFKTKKTLLQVLPMVGATVLTGKELFEDEASPLPRQQKFGGNISNLHKFLR